ncbi:Trm112 family protein [Oceanidesulfovibrio indonesiensis]|nr:Trm112 family protein [Oceanidesulfovibrio indonesiensis]
MSTRDASDADSVRKSLEANARRGYRADMAIDKELLDILVSPKTKAPVTLTEDGEGLYCEQEKMVYPIRDDIPIMLVEEAIPFDEWQRGKRQAIKPGKV